MRDDYIDKKIGAVVIANNEEKEKNHISSGKLSASMLGEPLQWQILKIKGVDPKPFDEYTLRKFLRGKEVELWLLQHLDSKAEADGKQDFVEYRDVVGYIDAICDTSNWDNNVGIIPVEIKSVSNAKFKRVEYQGADRGHKLQGCLYALAKKTDHFAVMYISTDDLRVITYIYKTEEYKKEVDQIIDTFNKQLEKGVIPVFEPIEKWQSSDDYNKYPEWSKLSEEEIAKKYENYLASVNGDIKSNKVNK